jgi:electron transfer flavoprotein alpha subunit
MSGVLVLAETRRGAIRDVTWELLAAGRALSDAGAGPLRDGLAGGDAALAGALSGAGAEEILHVPLEGEHFDPAASAAAVEALIDDCAPAVVLAGHTVDGMALAPALAARRRLGFASNVVSVGWEDGALRARRGLYGDRLLADLAFPEDRPAVVMLRPGAVAPAPAEPGAPVRALPAPAAPPSARHLGFREPADDDGVDIAGSDFLLAIGRGIGEEEHVERFAALARSLGADLAASRPLVDAGWVPSARQVGQSGRTVKPKVYLALGISGAVQHLAGIRDAETVIAVNSDPDAPIFGAADFGAAVDLFDLADALEARAAP